MGTKSHVIASVPHDAVCQEGTRNSDGTQDRSAAAQAAFVGLALEMSWQMAIVVIVPIVGGYKLDEWLHMAPWLTLVGLALAAAGTAGVMIRILKKANQCGKPKQPRGSA